MAVSKTSAKEIGPTSRSYVVDLYGDVEYMCGGNVSKVRNALVRQGADRASAMRLDIYNGVVSWVNPDGSPASFVSSGGGAALVTVRRCVVRKAGYAALPWTSIDGYVRRRKSVEDEMEQEIRMGDVIVRVSAIRKECEKTGLPYDSDSAAMHPPMMDGVVPLAERAAAAVAEWKDANARSYKSWMVLAADFPGICSVYETPAEWAWISDGNDIDAAGESDDPSNQTWIPDRETPDFIKKVVRWVKRVSDLSGRDIMAEAEKARRGFQQ